MRLRNTCAAPVECRPDPLRPDKPIVVLSGPGDSHFNWEGAQKLLAYLRESRPELKP